MESLVSRSNWEGGEKSTSLPPSAFFLFSLLGKKSEFEEEKQGEDFGKLVLELPSLQAAGSFPQSLARARKDLQSRLPADWGRGLAHKQGFFIFYKMPPMDGSLSFLHGVSNIRVSLQPST